MLYERPWMNTTPQDGVPTAEFLESDTQGETLAKLTVQGPRIITELWQLRISVDAQARAQRIRTWVTVVVGVLLLLVVLDNRLQIATLKRQLCPMVVGIIPTSSEPQPPAGPDGDRGRAVIGIFRGLADDFGCELRG